MAVSARIERYRCRSRLARHLHPQSTAAIDRGLAALLVALVRLNGTELNRNDKAGRIDRHHPHVQAAVKAIIDRA